MLYLRACFSLNSLLSCAMDRSSFLKYMIIPANKATPPMIDTNTIPATAPSESPLCFVGSVWDVEMGWEVLEELEEREPKAGAVLGGRLVVEGLV